MLINDKFCLSRFKQLQLAWSRIGLYERRQPNDVKTEYPTDSQTKSGGACETSMAHSTTNEPGDGRSTALGSSLSVATPMECIAPIRQSAIIAEQP
jgi:hypothetical protein